MDSDAFQLEWKKHWGITQDAFAVADWEKASNALIELEKLMGDLVPQDVHRGRFAEAKARVAEVRGQSAEAETHYVIAEKIFREGGKMFSREHAGVLMSWGEMTRRSAGWTRAMPIFVQALAVWEDVAGLHAPEVIACLSRLGTAQCRSGDRASGERTYRRALKSCDRTIGAETEDAAWLCVQLADTVEALGRLDDALPLLERAVAIYEKRLGEKHQLLARALHATNRVLRKKSDFTRAEEFCKRALAMRAELLGSGHPEHLESLGSYAMLLHAMGRTDEAAAMEAREKELTPASVS